MSSTTRLKWLALCIITGIIVLACSVFLALVSWPQTEQTWRIVRADGERQILSNVSCGVMAGGAAPTLTMVCRRLGEDQVFYIQVIQAEQIK